MKVTRWQFSLRQLLMVMTFVAVVVMLVSHQWRFVVGLATAAAWFLDVFYWVVDGFLKEWSSDRRSWRPHKPTEKEIQEFAARYPKRPEVTPKSPDATDSKPSLD